MVNDQMVNEETTRKGRFFVVLPGLENSEGIIVRAKRDKNPRIRAVVAQKSLRTAGFFSSATRTRTGVYGVRGRCPRPLDDSTRKCPR